MSHPPSAANITGGPVGLSYQRYGKDRVRVFKIIKSAESPAWYDVYDATFRVLLDGPHFSVSYTHGDNGPIVPTDTVKNIIYALHATSPDVVWESGMERVACHIAHFFMLQYPELVDTVDVTITDTGRWQRVAAESVAAMQERARDQGLKAHPHAFTKASESGERWTQCRARRCAEEGGKALALDVTSGFRGLGVLKTTGSAFRDFHRCPYTTLPDALDRVLCTDVECEWSYSPIRVTDASSGTTGKITTLAQQPVDYTIACSGVWPNYDDQFKVVRDTTLSIFSHQSSESVQATLYDMGKVILKQLPRVDGIMYKLPNKHIFAADMKKLGFPEQGDAYGVYMPIADPAGLIVARVSRNPPSAKL